MRKEFQGSDKLLVGGLLGLVTGVSLTSRFRRTAAHSGAFGLAGKALLVSTIISTGSVIAAVGLFARVFDVYSVAEARILFEKACKSAFVPPTINDEPINTLKK